MKKISIISMLLIWGLISSAQTTSSVLSTGDWYKISVDQTGIYKITYSDLQSIGIDPATIDPANIRIYGNGNDMLSEWNYDDRPDDLLELAIQVEGQGDGTFDSGDYILFYGEGPVDWVYSEDNEMFLHSKHLYSDLVYYFLTIDTEPGKRIEEIASSVETVSHIVTSFDDYQYTELDVENFLNSGKLWVGEDFDITLSRDYGFIFPNLNVSFPVKISSDVYGRCSVSSSFDLEANGSLLGSQVITPTSLSTSSPYAYNNVFNYSYTASNDNILINLTYDKPNSDAIGWLNFLCINARRDLIMDGPQMQFRDMNSIGTGNISEFQLSNVPANAVIWNVTDHQNGFKQGIDGVIVGGDLSFVCPTDSISEFIIFDDSDVNSPLIESIENQNLHALQDIQMIIVTHEDFYSQALQLKSHHEMYDGLNVEVVTVDQVYNEFSSGMQDISAIRDFMKYLYDNATSDENRLKYLLLFGCGSYDYKDVISENTNYVPTYQSQQSTRINESFCADDFFGLLNDSEGEHTGLIDIGIGRIPVATSTEAQAMVDKVIYYNTNPGAMGPWRNNICLIGDDGDFNTHMNQAESHFVAMDTTLSCVFIDKIYMDAYTKYPVGAYGSYPDVKDEITDYFNNGALIINFTGHGGVGNWTHEDVLDFENIIVQNNIENLPFVIAATCYFNQFDDPEVSSEGKEFMLSPLSGGIAVFSATRNVYSSPSFGLNNQLTKFIADNYMGNHRTLGDAIKEAKNASGSGINKRMFTLLGDPAVTLKFPENKVYTSYINGVEAEFVTDTFTIGELMNIDGYVGDPSGTILSDFDGDIHISLFNPMRTDTTLGNEGDTPMTFDIQDDIIITGTGYVTDGYFSVSITVPSGVSLTYGSGKILYYADNDITDAMGCYTGAVIGDGTASSPELPELTDISIYPTLTQGEVNMDLRSLNGEEVRITVQNVTGAVVHTELIRSGDSIHKINIAGLQTGMYFVNIESNNGYYRTKLVKQ